MTWNNRQSGDTRICCKLDRVMVNLAWMDVFRSSEATFHPPGLSDHSPVVVGVLDETNFGPKPFRFFEAWIGREGFDDLVRKGWEQPVSMSLNPILWFAAQLRNVKELRKWNKECIGDVFLTVKAAETELYQTQCNLGEHPDDPNLVLLETQAKVKLWEALATEEKFLKEKSRVKHIQLGDGNNSFFHKSMICRQHRRHILEIQGEGGNIVKDPSQIKGEAVSFYKKLFGADSVDNGFMPSSVPLQHGDPVLAYMGKGVETSVLSMELLAIHRGVALCLERNLQHVSIRSDSKLAVEIITVRRVWRELNQPADFIASIDCEGRETILYPPDFQDDLMRMIHDETSGIEQKAANPTVVLKVDLHKAYDSLSRNFLFGVMERMGFTGKFIGWVKACVTTPMFSVLINGSPTGYFKGDRGIRQGDLLSPYLFTIAMEAFSGIIRRLEVDGQIKLLPRCKALHLSHLIFADDLMIFVKANRESVLASLGGLDEFAGLSGLHLNRSKSSIIVGGLTQTSSMELLELTGFSETTLPI
ncbi:uncharacterized protein LOC122647823, partial [Telopea speciosissima]|uniref:uncharacterized protein LOC122647823 n=1 Tax=Telopea speciosissima TaxID=54955 RepID=UPI001CC60C4F